MQWYPTARHRAAVATLRNAAQAGTRASAHDCRPSRRARLCDEISLRQEHSQPTTLPRGEAVVSRRRCRMAVLLRRYLWGPRYRLERRAPASTRGIRDPTSARVTRGPCPTRKPGTVAGEPMSAGSQKPIGQMMPRRGNANAGQNEATAEPLGVRLWQPMQADKWQRWNTCSALLKTRVARWKRSPPSDAGSAIRRWTVPLSRERVRSSGSFQPNGGSKCDHCQGLRSLPNPALQFCQQALGHRTELHREHGLPTGLRLADRHQTRPRPCTACPATRDGACKGWSQ